MNNDAPEPISREEISRLKGLLKTFQSFASENEALTTKLGLKNKFVETIGEGLGLLFCHEKFRSKVQYRWAGRRRRGFDISLHTPEGRQARIQVKTNTDKEYDFKLFTIRVNREAKKQLKAGRTEALYKQIDAEVAKKDADFFLLVHWYQYGLPTYYVLDKNRLKRAIHEDYQVYFDRKNHQKRYHFGISEKTGMLWLMLNKHTVDSIGRFENDWTPVKKALGL
jgi:hypothetical protein